MTGIGAWSLSNIRQFSACCPKPKLLCAVKQLVQEIQALPHTDVKEQDSTQTGFPGIPAVTSSCLFSTGANHVCH